MFSKGIDVWLYYFPRNSSAIVMFINKKCMNNNFFQSIIRQLKCFQRMYGHSNMYINTLFEKQMHGTIQIFTNWYIRVALFQETSKSFMHCTFYTVQKEDKSLCKYKWIPHNKRMLWSPPIKTTDECLTAGGMQY